MLALATAALCIGACAGAGRPPRADPPPPRHPIVRGRPLPWDSVSVRFLGLRELGEGDAVELSWEIRHPVGAGVSAIPVVGAFSNAEAIEMRIERAVDRMVVRVRVSIEDRYPVGSQVGTTVGLQLEAALPRRARWELAPRVISLREPMPGRPERPEAVVTFDGRLEVEPSVAPDVPMRDGRWVMQVGTRYEIAYRVHNRSDADATVRIQGRTPGREPLDEIRPVRAGQSTVVDLSTMPSAGSCEARESCHVVQVSFADGGPWVDAVDRQIEVE